jgi:hypothetical protein
MMNRFFFSTLIFLFFFLSGFAQSKVEDYVYKSARFNITPDSCFAKTLTYLQTHNYFIEAVDKASGFIRAKIYTKNNKVFTSKAGERRTIIFLLRPIGNQTQLLLNVYSETFNRGGNTSSLVYYYEDQGIVNEPAIYQQLITDLNSALQ